MADIATVFVRLEFAPGAPPCTADDFFRTLLHRTFGPYHVTLWHRFGDGMLDLQYGAKWTGALAVENTWKEHSDSLRSVWVRDTSGEPDVISHRTAEMAEDSDPRTCDYWYDSIRLVLGPGSAPGKSPGANWSATPDGWYCALGDRRRHAANERDMLGDFERPTPTENVWAHPYFTEEWREELHLFGVPENLVDDAAATPGLQRLELRWRGRTVEVVERVHNPNQDGNWIRMSLDDWDTCADTQYLNHFGMSSNT